MMMMWEWLNSPVAIGALSGFLSAARIDYAAFATFKTPTEAVAYNWKIALWRWFQGAVIGAITARELGVGWPP